MTTADGRSDPILWGMPVSLWTGKARSYLRHNAIPFDDRVADREFRERVAPQVGRWIIPVLELPDGTLIQDSAAIIDHFEKDDPRATPTTPRHAAVSALFELFGGEGLVRPAMHYRWNFDDENLDFIRDEFTLPMHGQLDAQGLMAMFDKSSGRMRKAGGVFGVQPQTIPAIEDSYAEFLTLFDAHLRSAPYLLGGRATRGDYGLIAPLFAHLGRDPYPADLMKRTAPAVYRWTERMNAPGSANPGPLFEDDGIPDTLLALMRFIARDFQPEILAHVGFANDWLAARQVEAGTNGLDDPGARMIGMADFEWRGTRLKSGVFPYRFWLLQRVQRAAETGGDSVNSLFADAGLGPLIAARTVRPVERSGNLEIWGDAQDQRT